MADTLQSVFDLPDVSFVDDDTLEGMMQRLITSYETRYKEITGQNRSLAQADPIRILLYAVALDLFQIEQYVDRAGKQDLLKYSYGEFLDNLAGNRGVVRQQPTAATTTLQFTLSETRPHAVGIPAGTRATNGDGVYFQTVEYGEIPTGETTVSIKAECTEVGIGGNGFVPGQVNILVDQVAYVKSVANTTTTGDGTDLETDESLAERTFIAPSRYSVAGPSDAYIYWTRTYNADIGSVKVTSPAPCDVVVYFLKADGSLPDDETIPGLQAFLQDGNIRPLTDRVTVKKPDVENFTVDMTYYINRSDASSAATIQTEVANAVASYIKWQTTEIGKDINPSELVKRVIAAGAKRVVVTSPVFAVISDTTVAQCSGKSISYGGLEDD